MSSVAKDLSNYLSSVADLYPAGIPSEGLDERHLQNLEKRTHNKLELESKRPSRSLLWLGYGESLAASQHFPGESGKLLRAAIEKGLKLKLTEVEFLDFNHVNPAADLKSYLKKHFEASSAKIVIAHGQKIKSELGMESKKDWQILNGKPLLFTYDPLAVVQNPSLKRAFWEDLKKVIKKLKSIGSE